jgi:hypothetical protein
LTFQTSFSEISIEKPSASTRQSDPSDALVAKVIDPAWDPIRGDTRFRQLLAGKELVGPNKQAKSFSFRT